MVRLKLVIPQKEHKIAVMDFREEFLKEKESMLIGLTQQGTRFRCLFQLILAVPAIESGIKLIHTNHIL